MAEKQDIQENAMAGGTPTRLRGLAANGNSISPTLEEVMNAMGMVTYNFTLSANEEKDLGNIGTCVCFLTSPTAARTAIYSCGAYQKCFVSDGGNNLFCDYTDGTKIIVFGRKEVNGSFFIKNNRDVEAIFRLKVIKV